MYGNYSKKFCEKHGMFFVTPGKSFDCPECEKNLKKMADISMCKGLECPLKESCYRYKAPVNEYMQSYFVEVPFDFEKNSCEHFWSAKMNETGELLEW